MGSKVSDLNSTVRLCSKEIIDLKQSQDQNIKLRKQIEKLEKRNQDLVSCKMAMHATAKAEK